MRLARILGVTGRVLISAGVLILLFVAYQLWGTGIRERQAQDRLEKRFQDKLEQVGGGDDATVGASSSAPESTTTVPGATTTVATLPASTAPPLAGPLNEGDPAGHIEIPKIGLDAFVVEGVGVEDLKEGPGHYPETPLPGQKGNASLAGHRTTYGAPFANVDELAPGDQIIVTTVQGRFTYAVTDPPYVVVSPSQVEVLNDVGDNRLTLTACHPKYSASERIVVSALLQGEPAPTPTTVPRPAGQAPTLNGLGGKRAAAWPAVLYGLLCAVIWLLAWYAGRLWRKWPSYALGFPLFLVALFYFFETITRVLPSNF
jgi:sortase A